MATSPAPARSRLRQRADAHRTHTGTSGSTRPNARGAVTVLFASCSFLAAALVFLVQPMVVKQLLPVFGGSPSLWNTAVVFFQAVLLCGYALAHLTLRWLPARRQAVLQLALTACAFAFVPFALRTDQPIPDGTTPALWVFALLAIGVGVPYLAVTTVSPVLQRWYATLARARSGDPYFLYVASNAGSLLGLLAFPFLLEPSFSTGDQERIWAVAFTLFAVALTGCAAVVARSPGAAAAPSSASLRPDRVAAEPVARVRALRWVALAAVPSALMLSVTTYLTTDIASVPLLWVVPLALYLLSFVVTFGERVRVGTLPAGIAVALLSIPIVIHELDLVLLHANIVMGMHLAAVFAASVLAHASLHADRPAASQLTWFYLLLSLGGVVGGAFVAFAAPVLFDSILEYPLLLAAPLLVRPVIVQARRIRHRRGLLAAEVALATVVVAVFAVDTSRSWVEGWVEDAGWPGIAAVALPLVVLSLRRVGIAIAVAGLFVVVALQPTGALYADRNFFGMLRVEEELDTRSLLHGTTLHGTQFRGLDRRDVPTTYYSHAGPVGDIFEKLQYDGRFGSIGAVGLGTGTLASHLRAGQGLTYYEIDPGVVDVANRWFTYLRDTPAKVDVVLGDARIELAGATDGSYDLLVLDAYSSDSVPVHLLTLEAFERYTDKLANGGTLAVHISSRHLDLEPVVAAIAQRLQLASATRVDEGNTVEHATAGGTGSQWIVLARGEFDIVPLLSDPNWRPLRQADQDDLWTDDHSDIVSTWLRSGR